MDTPVAERTVVDIPTTPGVSWGGGIYMGRAVIGLAVFAIVLAPKSEGEFVDRQWHDDSEDRVEGALSYFDGLANTDAMVAAGSQLAKDVRDLRIGGYDDWFLPSRQDALVIMGNLAAAGDAFGKGGNQEFDRDSWYWTSTQSASHPDDAWVQGFSYGYQNTLWKDDSNRARAVRRVAL